MKICSACAGLCAVLGAGTVGIQTGRFINICTIGFLSPLCDQYFNGSADDEMPKLHKNRSEVLVSVILGLKILMIPSGWELQRSALFTVASSRRGCAAACGAAWDVTMTY